MTEDRYPPVTALAMASLTLIVAGGIYLSAHLPEHVSLTPAIILLVLSTLLLVVNLVLLSRVKDFNWGRFFQVGKWSLLAYVAIAGMLLVLIAMALTPAHRAEFWTSTISVCVSPF